MLATGWPTGLAAKACMNLAPGRRKPARARARAGHRARRVACKAAASIPCASWWRSFPDRAPSCLIRISALAHFRSHMLSSALALALAMPASSAFAAARPAAAPTPAAKADDVTIPVQRLTLPNGLVALVYTDHSAPSVYVGIRYRVGSRDEGPGHTGFAHFFEHLMFQSTRNRQGDLLPVLTAAGADNVNGMTTTDWTEYHETVPTGALDLALWLESDRMANLAGGITAKEFEEQRGVVKNEKRAGEMAPGAAISARFLAGFYPPGHPYAHPVIGAMDDLDKASPEDVAAWFNDYYGAANAVIVLAGDIDLPAARDKLTRYFGPVRPGKAFDRVQQWVPQLGAIKRDQVFADVATATISRSWPIPNDDPRTLTLLQLAARTMAGNRNTALHQQLVEQRRVADGVSASLDESQLGSVFTLSIGLHPGVSVDQANAALDEALAGYLEKGPDQERLDAVITATGAALLGLMESAPAVGGFLLGGEVEHGDPLHFLKQRTWIGAATPLQTRDAARAWLTRPYFETQVLPRPRLVPTGSEVDRTALPVPTPASGQIAFPPVHTARLANGLDLVVTERHGLPLVQALVQFPTGWLADPQPGSGTAIQAFAMLGAGTATRSDRALAQEMARLGTTLTASPGAQRSGIGWSTTTNRLEATLALAADMVRHPAYPQDKVDRALAGIDAAFEARERNPAAAADALLNRALWGADHPLGRIATRADARKLSRSGIATFHDNHIVPAGATLFLVGDVTLERARALAERYLGDWHGAPAAAAATAAAPASASSLPAPAGGTGPRVILVDAPGAPQATITAGELVGPFDPDKSATEALMNAALGGSFDSRLNTELRQRRGWAYGVGSSIGGLDTGPRLFSVGGGVQPDKAAQSIIAMRDQIAAYTGTAPITAEELDRERMASIRALPASFASNGAILGALTSAAASHLPWDRAAGTADRLKAVTLADVRAYAAATLHPDRLTWVIVGDLKTIEAPIRALNLGPAEVWDVDGNRLR